MIRTLLAFVVGVAVTASVFLAYAVPSIRENWRAQGFNEGLTSSRWEQINVVRWFVVALRAACRV